MALLFMSLASVITVIGRVRIVAWKWVWQVIFLFLQGFFLLSRFFFFDDKSGDGFFDDKSDDDGSGSGLSGTCPFSFSENSVCRVSGIFLFSRVIGILSFSQVNGIFSFGPVIWIFSSCWVKSCQVKSCRVKSCRVNWILSRSKKFLISNSEFLI